MSCVWCACVRFCGACRVVRWQNGVCVLGKQGRRAEIVVRVSDVEHAIVLARLDVLGQDLTCFVLQTFGKHVRNILANVNSEGGG